MALRRDRQGVPQVSKAAKEARAGSAGDDGRIELAAAMSSGTFHTLLRGPYPTEALQLQLPGPLSCFSQACRPDPWG